jgi:D-alanyl-D-alanine-carboxypeptidase/D-alanyl-D-alanine-endopeptidase
MRSHSLTLVLALALTSLAHAQNAAPLPELQQAGALGADLFAKSSSTGMVLVIVRNNQVFFHGYGETAPGSGVVPNRTSLLRLCSLSKIFATDLLIKLAADNTVRLDAPLQLYSSPHIEVPARAGRSITLEDLGMHTAGLPREVGPAPHGAPHFTFPDYAYRWRWLPRQHLKTTPGTAALYSNIGFDLLGDALAHAAREPYARLFHDRIAAPLGMHETGFTPTAAQCVHLLRGTHDEGPCTDTQSSAASIGHLAQDPAAQAVYLHPETLTSQQGLDHAGTPTGIGLGWIHTSGSTDPATPVDIIEKTGGGAGFVTYIALNRQHHIAIFAAFTDGPAANHFNVFKQTNNFLLTLAGLPPLPPEPPKPHARPARKKPRKHAVTH